MRIRTFFLIAMFWLLISESIVFGSEGRPRIPLAGKWKAQFGSQISDGPERAEWFNAEMPGRLSFGDAQEALWLEKEITVPADFNGRRVVVRIGKVAYGARVYLNGHAIGEVPGYGAELDLTAHVRFGESNTLRLFFGIGGKGIASLDKVTRTIAERLAQQAARGGWDWGSKYAGVMCEPENFYVEAQNPEIVVTDVWYKTYTRGYPRIEPEATVLVRKAQQNVTAHLYVFDRPGAAPLKRVELKLGDLAVGEKTFCLPVRADGLKLWDLRKPNLYYGQVVLFDADGRELDRTTPVRFGIREFYPMGREWYLNGNRVHFTFSWCGANRAEIEEKFNRGITLFASAISRPGVFVTRVHIEVPPVQAKICDELGAGLTYIGCGSSWLDLVDPETYAAYKTWVREHLRRLRNHPSILMWCIGMNTPGNYLDFSPTKIGREFNNDYTNIPATLAYLAHAEADPTRLNYFHGGPRGGSVSTGNIYFNHMPTQEIEDWLSEWSRRGDRPVIAVEFMGGPIGVDYLIDHHSADRASFATEYLARTFGDRAYSAEPDEYVRYRNYDLPRIRQTSISNAYWQYRPHYYFPLVIDQIAEAHVRTTLAWRFFGVPQYSWAWSVYGRHKDVANLKRPKKLDELEETDKRLQAPIQVWIGGDPENWTARERNYFGGEQIVKSLLVVHDASERARWEVSWEVRVVGADGPFAGGRFERIVTPFARLQLPMTFSAPDVEENTKIVLTAEVTDKSGGERIAAPLFEMNVFPAGEKTAAGRRTKWAIFDPEGETGDWLDKLGVTCGEWHNDGKKGADVLIVGRRALAHAETTLPFSARDVADGLRVVIFEQHCDDLGKFGFRHEDRCPRQVFIRTGVHPVLAGVENGHLCDWRGFATLISSGPDGDRTPSSRRLFHWGNRGNVASNVIETPHFGPFTALVDCEFDLAYSPLVSWRHGRGEVLFCQLDLVGRVGREPAATKIAANLITYLDRPADGDGQDKIAVAVGENSRNFVSGLGFAVAENSAELLAARKGFFGFFTRGGLDPKRHVAVVSGADDFAGHWPALRDFAHGGGDVLIVGVDEKTIGGDELKAYFSPVGRMVMRAGRSVENDPLLFGVGPQHIRWRETLDFVGLAATGADTRTLLGGLLGVAPIGRGRLITMQATPAACDSFAAMAVGDPDRDDKDVSAIGDDWRGLNRRRGRWQMNRLNALLLANLGLGSSDALVERLFSVRREIPFAPVNEWAYLGPFPAADRDHPQTTDLGACLAGRDVEKHYENSRGERVSWYFPTDSQNGMGMGGTMDLARVYGVRVTDCVAAVTQVWSTRERTASVKYGGDWWTRLIVNGQEVPGHGHGFSRAGEVHLRAGWNDVVCISAAGSNGHWFQFHITNPGDVVVSQSVSAPEGKPENLPPVERLIPEKVETGFSFYTDKFDGKYDPYDFIPW